MPSTADRIGRVVVSAVVLLGVLFLLGFQIDSVAVAPGHAIVLLDTAEKVYLAPPCVDEWRKRGRTEAERIALPYGLVQARMSDAQKAGYKPDAGCRDGTGFTQEMRSLSGEALERIGIIRPLKSRWNPDGTWNW